MHKEKEQEIASTFTHPIEDELYKNNLVCFQ